MVSLSNMQQGLTEAIENLYRVFSGYLFARRIEGCPHCVSVSDEDRLQSKPLRSLTAQDLHHYTFKAMTTWGTEEDFKHFLPRLFELVLAEESITDEMDAEVLFGKLTYAHWQQWPLQEREAVKDYLDALWLFLLSQSPEVVTFDNFVCAYGHAVNDLTPYLAMWANTKTTFSLGHYFDFLSGNESTLQKRKLTNAFWSERREQMHQVVEWVTSVETEEKMEQMLDL